MPEITEEYCSLLTNSGLRDLGAALQRVIPPISAQATLSAQAACDRVVQAIL